MPFPCRFGRCWVIGFSLVLLSAGPVLGEDSVLTGDGSVRTKSLKARKSVGINRAALATPVQLDTIRYYRCSTSGSWSVVEQSVGTPAPEGFQLQTAAPRTAALRGNFGCPQGSSTTVSHTDADFGGDSFIVQAGFAENEIAAASYVIPAGDFPIQIDTIEAVFAQQSAVVTTTTQWSILVWEGTPNTGNLVAEFMSDDVILPNLVLPPGTQGSNLLVTVDPSDPKQIVINDIGNQTFSVGYRIDVHNNQTQNPCFTAPPSNSNAFPTTDVSGLAAPTQNWLFGVNCGIFGCPPNGGWTTFQNLNILCRPSGDWVIRASYCALPGSQIGACCEPDGACTSPIDDASCSALGGVFQGDGSDCASVMCPNLFGACCRANGTCDDNDVLQEDCEGLDEIFSQDMTCAQVEPCPQPAGACCTDIGAGCVEVSEAECIAPPFNGVWLGAFVPCSPTACEGACCNPTTGFCSIEDEALCNQFGSQFQGPGTTCVGPSNNECPMAACCLPDGMCIDATVVDCTAQGGDYNDGEVCASFSCPQPLGACCLTSGGCLSDITQMTCEGQGQIWAGPGTVCPGDCQQSCLGGNGDMNTDLNIDGVDIQGFVDCMLTGSSPDPNVNCDCGDFDGMNGVDAADLPGMINALTAP